MNARSTTRKLAQAVGTLARRAFRAGLGRGKPSGALAQWLSSTQSLRETPVTQQLVDAGLAGLAVLARHGPYGELRVSEVASSPWLRSPEPGTALINRLTVAGSILMDDLQRGQPFVINNSASTINVTFEWSRGAALSKVMIVPLCLGQYRPGALALFGEVDLSPAELQQLAVAVSQRLNTGLGQTEFDTLRKLLNKCEALAETSARTSKAIETETEAVS